VQTECCGSGDCLGRVCKATHCEPCASTGDCGKGQVCCNGLCRDGACCTDAHCALGQRCRDFQCAACTYDGECAFAERCCGGACVPGTCCSGTECASGLCEKNQCTSCSADAQCGSGKVCCKGACVVDGACEATLGLRDTCTPACPAGRLCCSGKCLLAQCCTDTDCAAYPSAPMCIAGACQKCTADGQCPANSKCCGGACHPGTCCTGQLCASGQPCLAYACADCTADADCGAGKRCCTQGASKKCVGGGCCTDDDCAPYLCVNGQCGTCSLDTDCEKGSKCCSGVCYANATCCTRADCSGGQVCSTTTHKCGSCVDARQCGLGGRCCAGQCSLGSCCDNTDCNTATTGLVCTNGVCALCMRDSQCNGAHCCAGKCTSGCCTDADCPKGQLCQNGACGTCALQPTDAGLPDLRGNCGFGQVCCPVGQTGQRGCMSGTCCTNDDCTSGGLVCDPSRNCTQCTAVTNAAGRYVSSDCGSKARCCSGACYSGDCCDNTDCSCGGALCINGACTSCKVDSDCGGGMACCPSVDPDSPTKVCKPFCSTSKYWDEAMDFDTGTFAGLGHTLASAQALDPDCTRSGYLCLTGAKVWQGTWTVVYDSGITSTSVQQPFWKTLTLKAKIPLNTGVAWRMRVADSLPSFNNNLAAWSDWMAVVPTSTDYATYPADVSYVPGVNNPLVRNLLQVQVRLESSVATLTPVLDSLKIDWLPDDPLTDCVPCGSGYFRCGGACCACETCASLGRSCGAMNDRCGHTLSCGNCPSVPNGDNVCSANGKTCELVCQPGYNAVGTCCAASSCATLGKECDDWPDGCGGTLHCGVGVCPNPANGSGFCNPQGLCDVQCDNCYGKSGLTCVRVTETFNVNIASAIPNNTVYVAPAGVGSYYHTPVQYTAQASVTTKSHVLYALSGQPGWLSIDPNTGALHGTPTNNSADPGVRSVTVKATTDCGSVGSTVLAITVLANEWCGDGKVNGNEVCDTQNKSCTANYVQGLPSYCAGLPVTGVQACTSDCKGWGACTAGQPSVSSNSFGECSNADITANGYSCCSLDSCVDDACCGGTNGTSCSLPGGYTQEARLPNSQSAFRGECRLGRNGTNWDIAVSHTTASYRCWK
jgi:hypothetical protein